MWNKKIIKEGKGHGIFGKHKWNKIDFRRQDEYKKRGLKSTVTNGIYLSTCDLYICSCGAEMIVTEFGFV